MTGPPEVKKIASDASPIKGARRTSPITVRIISKVRGIPTVSPEADIWLTSIEEGNLVKGVTLVDIRRNLRHRISTEEYCRQIFTNEKSSSHVLPKMGQGPSGPASRVIPISMTLVVSSIANSTE